LAHRYSQTPAAWGTCHLSYSWSMLTCTLSFSIVVRLGEHYQA